jgi:RNA polymerase primary sigma factor
MRQLKISKQITTRDTQSFNKYLTEVSNIPLLTSEEEFELSRKIQQEGDEKALEKLVNANLRFVISVAKQYNGQAPLIDLVQEGNAGLIKAAQKFDETRGFKFISYAVWWIRQSIMQYLSENQRQIRLPLNNIGALNKIKKATSELEQILERTPNTYEISEYLMDLEYNKPNGDPSKYAEDKIETLIGQSQRISHLDAPMTNEDESGNMLEIIPGEDEHSVNASLRNNDLRIELERIMKDFPFREREVITLYFGLFGREPKTLEEIGIEFDLTRERVRQIKEKALRRLKKGSSRRVLKEYR